MMLKPRLPVLRRATRLNSIHVHVYSFIKLVDYDLDTFDIIHRCFRNEIDHSFAPPSQTQVIISKTTSIN